MAKQVSICLPITVQLGGKTIPPGEKFRIDEEEAAKLVERWGTVDEPAAPNRSKIDKEMEALRAENSRLTVLAGLTDAEKTFHAGFSDEAAADEFLTLSVADRATMMREKAAATT
ncbi:MAG: hypothetical protein AAGL24_10020 [Pseudomonadota bacterium]